MPSIDSSTKPEPEEDDVQSSERQIVAVHSSLNRGGEALYQRARKSVDTP
jgi:hypothetical protein